MEIITIGNISSQRKGDSNSQKNESVAGSNEIKFRKDVLEGKRTFKTQDKNVTKRKVKFSLLIRRMLKIFR
ncbi:hypothetical protein AT268_34015 [Bacillus cereus]|uniref:Uncharacterized protein n=1 Tax=Bacillus cereus TaxID=1396 RepID=A0A9X0SML6_BACCE|nr:hypothetical protein AT268_34015 [Bacillus cereus]